jgi:hypothetical protein
MAFVLPSPAEALLLPNGLINPVWYRFLREMTRLLGGDTSNFPSPSSGTAGEHLQTDGATATWESFKQVGSGTVDRSWLSKAQDVVTASDFGASPSANSTVNTNAFNAALSAYSGVRIAAGTYSGTLTVAYDKIAILEPDANIGTISNSGTIIRFNYNPSGLTWTNWANKYNGAGLVVDRGYGLTRFGDAVNPAPVGLPAAIIGSTQIPSNSTNPAHGPGGAFYSRTLSLSTYAVGGYFQGDVAANGTCAWGGNPLVNDNAFDASQIWGCEINVNSHHSGTNSLGCDVVGGSTVESAGYSIGFNLGPYGVFASPPKRWYWGFKSADGAAIQHEIGAMSPSGSSIPSQPLNFAIFNAGGSRSVAGSLYAGGAGVISLDAKADAYGVRLCSQSGGARQTAFYAQGTALGFYGAGLVGRQTVVGSKGGNTALASLITALANTGLIVDGTS